MCQRQQEHRPARLYSIYWLISRVEIGSALTIFSWRRTSTPSDKRTKMLLAKIGRRRGVWLGRRRPWNPKSHLTDLEYSRDRSKSKDFTQCCFLAITEHLPVMHNSRLLLWSTGYLAQESTKEDNEEYFAILRDCRQRNAEIDAPWYAYLLDLMGFK